VEYLFWVCDPELTCGQKELLRTLEEGFMSATTYCVIVALIICDGRLSLSFTGVMVTGALRTEQFMFGVRKC